MASPSEHYPSHPCLALKAMVPPRAMHVPSTTSSRARASGPVVAPRPRLQVWRPAQRRLDRLSKSSNLPDGARVPEGQLNACKWLYARASADITRRTTAATHLCTGHVRIATCRSVSGCSRWYDHRHREGGQQRLHAHVHKHSFGHLSVCKWLFEVSAAADVTKANNQGKTYVRWLASGALSVCKWLYEVGRSANITTANKQGRYPMFVACAKGHLSRLPVVRRGRRRADPQDNKSGTVTILGLHAWSCNGLQWLIFNGAMNRLAPALDDGTRRSYRRSELRRRPRPRRHRRYRAR